MGYITSNKGRPIQGVSQQPEKTRLPGQCTASDNFRPDVVRGLKTRQGTMQAGTLSNASLDTKTKWHHYERGTGEEYFISIDIDGKVRAWSPDGTEHTINVEDNTEVGYLASENSRDNIKALTIGDFTFLVNKLKNITPSSTLTTAQQFKAIVYVQYMDYGEHVRLYIDGLNGGNPVAWYDSPNGDAADHIYFVKPEHVTGKLFDGLQGGSGSEFGYSWGGIDITPLFNITLDDNTIIVERIDQADFVMTSTDDANDNNTIVIKDKLKDTTLLPGRAPDGFKIQIDPPGSTRNENDSYWLEAVNSSSNHITWKESIEPGIVVGADASTMPHVLIRESIDVSGVATFTLREGEWEDREVGSDESNPLPSFIDTANPVAIQDIGLFQNRLFVTSGESVIMTRSDSFFNFFRETAQASLDTDPIDVFSDVPQVNFLESSVAFDGDLVLFSKNGQFIISGGEPITPSNATLRQATSFETQLTVDPVASGDNVFFAFRYGRFTGVREFFTDSITDTKRARPVTDHVKEYIDGDPSIMKASTNLNLLVIKTKKDDNILYTYDWLWQGSEKVQSAWGRVVFPATDKVLHFVFVDEMLWLVMGRDDSSVYIEKVDMGDPDDEGLTYPVRADRKTTGSMQLVDGKYSITDPMPLVDVDDIIAVRCTGAYEEEVGTPIDIYRVGGDLYTDEELGTGDVTVIIGRKYECLYTPTNPVAKDVEGQALNLDRLSVGAFYMNYNTTGNVTAEVQGRYEDIRVQEFNNRTLGGPENLIGFSPLVDGQHRVPIRKKSDRYTLTFKTSSHLPLEVRDFEFNGNLTRRGRRI